MFFQGYNVIDHRAARITGGHLFFGVLRIQQKGIQPSDWLKLKKSVPGFAFDLCLPAMDKSVSEPPNMKPYPLPTRFEYKRIGLTTCSSEGNVNYQII